MHPSSARTVLIIGFHIFRKRPWFFFGSALLIAAIGWAISFVSTIAGAIFGTSFMATVVQFLVSAAGQMLLGMGTVAFYLKAHDNAQDVQLGTLWHPKPFWKYVGTVVATTAIGLVALLLLVFVGLAVLTPVWSALSGMLFLQVLISTVILVALVVPALIPVVLLIFAPYFVIDRGYGPYDAIRSSAHVAREHFWQLLFLFVFTILLNIVGVLLLVVGMFATSAISGLAFAHAYRMFAKGPHLNSTYA